MLGLSCTSRNMDLTRAGHVVPFDEFDSILMYFYGYLYGLRAKFMLMYLFVLLLFLGLICTEPFLWFSI